MCATDCEFVGVNQQTFLEMAIRAGVEERKWPGYKEDYYEMSEDRKIGIPDYHRKHIPIIIESNRGYFQILFS